MLTIHDCTFEVRWSGWKGSAPYAERVAQAMMFRLLTMEAGDVRQLARSKRAQATMASGARIAIANLLAKRGRNVPQTGDIVLEVIACPKG